MWITLCRNALGWSHQGLNPHPRACSVSALPQGYVPRSTGMYFFLSEDDYLEILKNRLRGCLMSLRGHELYQCL